MKVFASKNLALAGLALAGVMGLSQSALAYTPSGSNPAGPGGTNLTVFGQSFPCFSTFTVNVVGGNATVTAATFTGGSAVCPHITANNLPWTIGAASATGTAGIYTATISGISVTVRQATAPNAIVATCVGSVTGTLDQGTATRIVNPHQFTFTGTLTTTAPVTGQNCFVSTQAGAYLGTVLTAP